jgi:N-acetylmuramoyl-L-alanine amidase
LSSGLGTQDNGVKTAEFFVCRNAPVAAVTAEVAFISNAKEEQLLRDQHFLDVAASSLLAALKEYFGDM